MKIRVCIDKYEGMRARPMLEYVYSGGDSKGKRIPLVMGEADVELDDRVWSAYITAWDIIKGIEDRLETLWKDAGGITTSEYFQKEREENQRLSDEQDLER